MSKWIFVGLAGLLIIPVFLFSGCDAVAPEVKTLQQQVAALVEWKGVAQGDINTAKSTAGSFQGTLGSLQNDVNALKSQVSTMGPNASYTKAEIDAKNTALEAKITALNTALATHSSSSSSSTTTPTTGGTGGATNPGYDESLLSSDGDLELWLRWIDPNRADIRFHGGDEVEFALAIKNKGTVTRKFSIEMRLSPDDDVVVAAEGSGSYLLAKPDMGDWEFYRRNIGSETDESVTWNTVDIGRISRGTSDNYNIRLFLDETTGDAYWKYKFYITQEED